MTCLQHEQDYNTRVCWGDGVQAKRFEEFFKDQTSFIRFNHYLPCRYPHLALGVGRHKDVDALTIFALDEVEGLEVKRKADQQWGLELLILSMLVLSFRYFRPNSNYVCYLPLL
jgi:hypothetical protein